MSVKDILKERMAFSFEVFPPKTDKGMVKLCSPGGVLDQLYELRPDYISCTYGAGGTNVGKNLEVLDKIKQDGKTEEAYQDGYGLEAACRMSTLRQLFAEGAGPFQQGLQADGCPGPALHNQRLPPLLSTAGAGDCQEMSSLR